MKIVTSDQMRAIDRKAAECGIATSLLMENAGRAVAEKTRAFVDYIAGRLVLVLAGPGNNGGDALVAARYLHEWGADVTIYLLSERPPEDKNMALAIKHGISLFYMHKDLRYSKLKHMLAAAEVVIDGILGTGRARPLEGQFKEIIDRINAEKRRRPQLITVAIDIPTGMNADNGGVDQSCIKADLTVTLGLPKPGLYSFPGAGMAGKVVIADIGIPASLSRHIKTELITSEWARSVLPARPSSANKGTFGRVLAVVGSENYIGAAYLACMGAARVGAGVVTLSTARSLQPILASKLTEITYAPLPETAKATLSSKASSAILGILPYYRVLLIGCGLGQQPHTRDFVKNILMGLPDNAPVLVLDADALNIVAGIDGWWKYLPVGTVVTPHAGEMSRLLGITIDKLQGNRLEMCRQAAVKWDKVVVLKGAYTIIADPAGRVRISDYASAGLATAGTGDVLAGVIAGLAGQGLSPFDAAVLGVHIHATAGELVRRELGDTGMLATDLLPALPKAIRNLKEKLD